MHNIINLNNTLCLFALFCAFNKVCHIYNYFKASTVTHCITPSPSASKVYNIKLTLGVTIYSDLSIDSISTYYRVLWGSDSPALNQCAISF
ncbi:hypothetical protein FKM82_018997 [Ascaphus truei]